MGAYNLSFSPGSALSAGLGAAFVHFGFGYGGTMLNCSLID